uniref:Uncharacterized protein n=1 Tax=Glossina pallidipes TaxID=7398 RepID=A0A1B0A6L8_GLOPL
MDDDQKYENGDDLSSRLRLCSSYRVAGDGGDLGVLGRLGDNGDLDLREFCESVGEMLRRIGGEGGLKASDLGALACVLVATDGWDNCRAQNRRPEVSISLFSKDFSKVSASLLSSEEEALDEDDDDDDDELEELLLSEEDDDDDDDVDDVEDLDNGSSICDDCKEMSSI